VPRERSDVDQPTLPEWWPAPLREAITDSTAGATGTALFAIEGLLALVDDQAKLAKAVALLAEHLPRDAPIWHIARAARSGRPAAELRRIRTELESAVPKTVATAARWAAEHGGSVAVAPSSSIVAQVVARLGVHATAGEAVVGLAGADAIGVNEVLNIKGTYELAQRVPTLVVTTSLKLVPESVFALLGAPVFERIPLSAFAGVVLDGEIIAPERVGRLAAQLAE
jgi:hypothetical protein